MPCRNLSIWNITLCEDTLKIIKLHKEAVSAWICEWCPAYSCQKAPYYVNPVTTPGTNMILPFNALSLCTTHTHFYIWRWCVSISPCASFPSSSICAGNLSYEPVSSEAREHLELRTERQDNTLKACCSFLIAHSSIPTSSYLSLYLHFIIAEAWRALDSWEKWAGALFAISAYLHQGGPLSLKIVLRANFPCW